VFAVVPRRAALVLPAIVFAVLAAASAVASNELAHVVNGPQEVLGPDRGWIDRAARDNVAYLYDGEEFWNIVWQERFWNPRIDQVYSISPASVAGPMTQTPVTVGPGGQLAVARAIRRRFGSPHIRRHTAGTPSSAGPRRERTDTLAT